MFYNVNNIIRFVLLTWCAVGELRPLMGRLYIASRASIPQSARKGTAFFLNTQEKRAFFNKIFILFASMGFFLYFCREIINMEKIGYACTFDKR